VNSFAHQNAYISADRPVPWLARLSPTLVFYAKILRIIYQSARICKTGVYGKDDWIKHSLEVIRAFESIGGRFHFENMGAFQHLNTPCIFVGNHMSIMETFVLPCLIRPYRPVTFVIKESLIAYPYFKHVMRSRNPIVVGRTNPREDFRIVLEEGQNRVNANISVVIFPQTTRSKHFDPHKFNSLGIKLARRCQVPVVPFALKTDAWENGRRLKDAGRIRPGKWVHISFGEPFQVQDSGKKAHRWVVDFITRKLNSWQTGMTALDTDP
jgi:1-acyl-sn-glycerol-3-phosphate acyltransferase